MYKRHIELHFFLEPDMKLSDVLIFMTGSNNIPAGGFSRKIDVRFRHGCKEGCHCKPIVSTCSLEITLPLYCSSEEDMKLMMIEAIRNSHGFGRV